jgi:hypothetical protein
MRELRNNTATRITVGPFLDKTDGITPEIDLTVTSELLTFVVDNAGVPTLVVDVAPTASGGANDMVHITSDAAGYYDLELAAANVNYLGRAVLSLNDVATHLPVFHEFMIITQAEYDRKYSTGASVADVKTVVDDLHTDVGTAITNIGDVHATDLPAAKTVIDAIKTVVDNIHDTDLPDVHTDLGTAIGYIDLEIADIHTDVGTAITNIGDVHATDLPAAKTVVDAIKVQTDKLAFTIANQIDANVIDWKGAAAPAMTGDAYAEAVLVHAHVADCATATVLGNVHTDVDNILADTNELQVDDYPTSIAAIKAETALIVADTNELQTDDYPTSIAAVKADTAAILTDTGTTLDTLIQDIPTVAEFNARTLVAADYTVVTDTIAAVTAATVTAIGANVITAASIAADAGTEIAAAVWAKTGAVTSIATELLLERLYEMVNNKMIVTEATGAVALRNIADSANVATGVVADLGATTQRDGLTWV